MVYNYPTTFTITALNQNDLPAYSYIKVSLPASISTEVGDPVCFLDSSAVSCDYDADSHEITVSSISNSETTTGNLPVLYIHNLYNPYSTKPTATFKFYILNSFGQVLEQATAGLTYSVSTPSQFSTLSLQSSSLKNSEGSTYMDVAFSSNMANGYNNQSLLVLTFPSEISVSGVTCSATSSNL